MILQTIWMNFLMNLTDFLQPIATTCINPLIYIPTVLKTGYGHKKLKLFHFNFGPIGSEVNTALVLRGFGILPKNKRGDWDLPNKLYLSETVGQIGCLL